MKSYYISKDSHEKKGPFNFEELKKIKIEKDTLVWHEGLGDWKYASEINELKDLISSEIKTKKKNTPPKRSLSNNEKLFLKYAKKNILKVPNVKLANALEKNNSTVSKAEKIFEKYPIHDILVPVLEGSISDLDLKLFNGQVKLGQDIKYFKKYFKNIENSGTIKSKDSEKTEITIYGKSKKINREIQSLILKFENEKLISFEDKRDNAITDTKKVSKKNFNVVWILNPIEIIEYILSYKLQDQFNSDELIKILLDANKNHKSKWKSSKLENIIDVLDKLDVIENIDNKILFELLVEESQTLKSLIKKCINLSTVSKRDLDFDGLLKQYVNKLTQAIGSLSTKLKSKLKKSTYYALDGSSMLDVYNTNPLVNLKNKLTLYEIEEEGNYFKKKVYSINEYIDLFSKEINTYKAHLNEIKKAPSITSNIDVMKESINNSLQNLDAIKLESEKKAEAFVKENKNSTLIGCLTLLVVGAIVIGVIWFLYSIF